MCRRSSCKGGDKDCLNERSGWMRSGYDGLFSPCDGEIAAIKNHVMEGSPVHDE